MDDLGRRVSDLHAQGTLCLPFPGGGRTADRHMALMRLGRADLSIARLSEAHADAMAILAELGRAPATPGIYGVWAADSPHGRLTATRREGGSWVISGIKQYCGGATIVEAALVTAHAATGIMLFEVPLDTIGVTVVESTWATAALSDTATGPVAFHDVVLPNSTLVGGPGWYLDRPGFWHGAVGPSAYWAGGALALIDAASTLNRRDPHSRAHLGALQATAWVFEAILSRAGAEIDQDGGDANQARVRALKVRHLIERGCTEVMDQFGRATGPQLLAYDAQIARQYAALALCIRQCHGERDLETIPA